MFILHIPLKMSSSPALTKYRTKVSDVAQRLSTEIVSPWFVQLCAIIHRSDKTIQRNEQFNFVLQTVL